MEIRQPKPPPARHTVTALEPGRSFTRATGNFLVRGTARHEIVVTPGGSRATRAALPAGGDLPGRTGERNRNDDDEDPREVDVHPETRAYNDAQAPGDRAICRLLATQIDRHLPEAENRIWHAHPVWFLEENPVVGYSKLKDCVRLLFWSGQSFEEKGLQKEGKFKAAEVRYTAADQVDAEKLRLWLTEARSVQWDYKNLIRRKGRLQRLK